MHSYHELYSVTRYDHDNEFTWRLSDHFCNPTTKIIGKHIKNIYKFRQNSFMFFLSQIFCYTIHFKLQNYWLLNKNDERGG